MTRERFGRSIPRRSPRAVAGALLAPVFALVLALVLALATLGAAQEAGGGADGEAGSDPWAGAEFAFVGPDGRLYAGWLDGREARPLSALGERAQFPSWSPDGTRVAAIVSDGGRGRVVVYDAAGDETELYAGGGTRAPIYHYWAPTSDAVAFLANAPGTGLELRLADLGGEEEALAAGSPFYWQWTSDGERLLIHSGFSGAGARLGFTDAGEDTLAENLDAPGFFQAPGIAPSGDWIAYSALAPSGARRVTLRSTADPDAAPRQVEHEGLAALAWSPVDDLLAFTSAAAPAPVSAGPLQLIDAADGFLRTLSDDLVLAFFWSPDGERIAYVTPLGDGTDPGRVANAPAGEARLQRVQRAPPLLQLRTVELASGEIRSLTTFAPTGLWLGQFLPFFDQYALSHRVWSQDGGALLLPTRTGDGPTSVTAIGLDGAATSVGAGDMPSWRWR